MKGFRGTGVALVTPFKNDMSVDFSSLGKIVEHVISGGVNYIVGLGTTAESATLTAIEKQAIISFLVDTIGGRVPLVVGAGGNNTQDVINFIMNSNLEGVSAILSVAPYYNKPGQRGLFMHYKAIANITSLPVILYNVPGRTSSNILPETAIELAKTCDNIIGIKEASGNIKQIMQLIKDKPDNFIVISGDDSLTIPIITMGGSGLISVVANGFPAETVDMVSHALKSNCKSAREIQYKLLNITDMLFSEGNPSGIKALLASMKLCQNVLRLPLVPVSKQLMGNIQKERDRIFNNQ